ncbi:MAG: PorP/SprF family type IX secretion system membrane protein [Bacteroidetes bacterium]|nr:PorP/SprF family type IX secretion system membrane protein [Bacteroidota bacterium]MCL1969474.1 PorP/SprF family type IX secretion system membrane protein [Bacteroidota bacterium]
MRIKYCFIFLFLFSFCKLFAQEDPLFTFFPWMHSLYNPSMMGEKTDHLNFTGILRQQSMGMHSDKELDNKDDPNGNNGSNPNPNPNGKIKYPSQGGQQILLNIDSYIKKIKGAVGVSFLKDQNATAIGFDNIGFKLGYASHFRVRRGKLGVGVQCSFLNMTPVSKEEYIYNDQGDQTIPSSGSGTSSNGSGTSFMDFDMSFGLQYRTPTWYVGVSGTQLLGGVRISGEKGTATPTRVLYVTGGYIWNLKTPVPWSIEPHLLLRCNISEWQFGAMALARYNGILWFGLSYQNMGVAALFGAVPFYNDTNEYLKGLEIGVSYTFGTTRYSYTGKGGAWGDFELVVRYGLNFYKEKALNGYGSSRHLYKNQY